MKAAALVLAFLAPLHAQSPDSLVFQGLGTSLGRGRSVTARVTFDRSRAAAGGFIFAAPEVSPRDSQAIRMSEGLLTTSGGLFGRAAAAARSHRVPALLLPAARWEKGPALVLDSPVFGVPRVGAGGAEFRLVERTVPLRIAEAEVVTIDPARGILRLYPPWRQAEELELSQALRAYDGLKDAQSLIQWLAARSTDTAARAATAGRLEEELAERALDGTAPAADFAKVARSLEAGAAPSGRKDLSARRKGLIERLAAEAASRLGEIEDALQEAGTAQAARRLSGQAKALRARLNSLGEACGSRAGLSRAEAAYARAAAVFARRLPTLAAVPDGDWQRAVLAAGGLIPRSSRLAAGLYDRFLDDGGIKAAIEEIAEDASLDLRRKSERIRALILAAKLPPHSTLAREILSIAPPGERLSVRPSGGDGQRRAVARVELLRSVQEGWASYWDAPVLGARKRKGGPLQPEAELVIEAAIAAFASGILHTREPGSGSRERMAVEAIAGELEALKSGTPSDQYSLDRRSGRETLPALMAGKRVLSSSQLEALARVGRAVENHFGRGVEVEFLFAGGMPVIVAARAMELSEAAPAGPAAVGP